MAQTLWQRTVNFFYNTILYQSTPKQPRFVLKESGSDGRGSNENQVKWQEVTEVERLLRSGQRLAQLLHEAIGQLQRPFDQTTNDQLNRAIQRFTVEKAETTPLVGAYQSSLSERERLISVSLTENEQTLASLYNVPVNKDMVMRKFQLAAPTEHQAMLLFIDGIVDKQVIQQIILKPLMLLKFSGGESAENLPRRISETCLPNSQTRLLRTFSTIEQAVNSGDAVLFIDGCGEAIGIEAKGGNRRSVSKPTTEATVRGSQEAFTEVLRTNTALIRSILRASDLVTEIERVGKRGDLQCAVMYLQSVVNDSLAAEVKRRLSQLDVAYIADGGQLMQLIVDHPYIWFPQSLSTERPDRAAASLVEGRVVIILEGSPFAHIVPISFFSLIHSFEDFSLPPFYGSMVRLIRVTGALLTTLLPGMFLALSLFHQEAIPTDLVLAISAAREQVPFPAIVEVVLMMGSFELIREGGLRIPGMLGPTIGIVGAIILGQAAVMAKIVSPIMIIVVAVTGLSSFTIPEYRLGVALRLLSYSFLIAGSLFGLVGIACGILLTTAVMSNMKSFGVPYLSPFAPRTNIGHDLIARLPMHEQERRPDELSTKDSTQQAKISRKWTGQDPAK